MLDQDETDLVSPVVLLKRLTQEPEYEADELSLNEVKLVIYITYEFWHKFHKLSLLN